jgi:hypothetical protein
MMIQVVFDKDNKIEFKKNNKSIDPSEVFMSLLMKQKKIWAANEYEHEHWTNIKEDGKIEHCSSHTMYIKFYIIDNENFLDDSRDFLV